MLNGGLLGEDFSQNREKLNNRRPLEINKNPYICRKIRSLQIDLHPMFHANAPDNDDRLVLLA